MQLHSYTSLPCSADRCDAMHVQVVGHGVLAAKSPQVN